MTTASERSESTPVAVEIPAWLPRREPSGRPASGRRLRNQGEATFRRLLEAGREAFTNVGYSAARVDDVVAIAGTSHGTFYLYFRNKEDLLHRLAVECGDELDDLTHRLNDLPRGADRAALGPWVADFADAYRRHFPVIRVWMERREVDPLMQARANDALGALADALTRRLDPAVAEAVGPAVAALGLLSVLERMSSYLVTSVGVLSDRSVVETVTTMLLATFGSAA